jgi:hypothetical protein
MSGVDILYHRIINDRRIEMMNNDLISDLSYNRSIELQIPSSSNGDKIATPLIADTVMLCL